MESHESCHNAGNPFIRLPTEIWIEIFERIETPQLYELTLVCKHWNQIIVSHLSDKFVLHFYLDRYPQWKIGVVSDRRYRHLCIESAVDCSHSSEVLVETVQHVAGSLVSLELVMNVLEYRVLVQLFPICTNLSKLRIEIGRFCDDQSFRGPIPALPSVRCLIFDVENFHNALFRAFPSVQKLNMDVKSARRLEVLEWMAPRLKVLKTVVRWSEIGNLMRIQLPALKALDLVLNDSAIFYYNTVARTVLNTGAFGEFLRNCSVLQTALLWIYCKYDQRILPVIFSSLPLVETLELTVILDSEVVSLNGLERMKYLKNLTLKDVSELELDLENSWDVQENRGVVSTVETFSVGYYGSQTEFSDFLKRFPNLKRLSFMMCTGDELRGSNQIVPLLEELTVYSNRPKSKWVNDMKQLVGLRKIVIDAFLIHEDDIGLLSDVIVLPNLKHLEICSWFSNISPDIVRTVAVKNEACKLIWNGELVTTF